jgi:arginyl-tRNA synthetase
MAAQVAVVPMTGSMAEPATARMAGGPTRPVAFGHVPDGGPASLVAFAGTGPVRYALCRAGSAAAAADAVHAAVKDPQHDPGYAVRYAHAHAAATLRQAAALGIGAGPAAFQARLLGHPAQQALLHALSWLPERVAVTALRGQPAVLTRYLEDLARAYHDVHESCPALPYAGGPADPVAARARLVLADAARTVLAAGLRLLGVGP